MLINNINFYYYCKRLLPSDSAIYVVNLLVCRPPSRALIAKFKSDFNAFPIIFSAHRKRNYLHCFYVLLTGVYQIFPAGSPLNEGDCKGDAYCA